MSKKLPFMKFYPWDWERDMAHHPPEIQAWWLLVCGRLHQAPERGRMTLTVSQWAGILRTTPDQALTFIEYLDSEGIAQVVFEGDPKLGNDTPCDRSQRFHAKVTLMSRRMVREETEKEKNRLRKRKQRRHAKVTPESGPRRQKTEDRGQKSEEEKSSSLRSEDFTSEPPRRAAPEAAAVVEVFGCIKGETYQVTEDQIAEWQDTFPAVDIRQELKRARAWLEANPAKRKTRRGMPRFLVNWFGRVQDRGGTPGKQTRDSPAPSPLSEKGQRTAKNLAAVIAMRRSKRAG